MDLISTVSGCSFAFVIFLSSTRLASVFCFSSDFFSTLGYFSSKDLILLVFHS
jgi:hypothetical protein